VDSLNEIPKIGPKTIVKLNKLGINKPGDLLYHFPNRYIDFSKHSNIFGIKPDENVTITGKIIRFQNIYTRTGKNIQKATVEDLTGQIELIWFNQPYLSQTLKINERLSFAGTCSLYQTNKTIIAPIIGRYNTGKIIAIYPETEGLKSGWFRKVIAENINNLLLNINETLPQSILKKHQLLSLKDSLYQIHQPENAKLLEQSRLRLGIDEILSLQANSYLKKQLWTSKTPKKVFLSSQKFDKLISNLIKSLPFRLTSSQIEVWSEIKSDLLRNIPTNRLLQGDVGSGKTIIAILGCYLAHLNKSTSLIIAPTEILANQHYETFTKLLKLPITLLTARSKPELKKLKPGTIIIGTHAAIYRKKVLKNKIGLLIIDEQHKFGVNQRSFLTNTLHPPHCLTMTATPIPRTISLTIMGNLDLSVIKSMPIDRLRVKTFFVPENKYLKCYQWLNEHITKTKEQAFIVCPFIEPSETLQSIKSAKKLYDHLKTDIFPKLNIGLIHGKIRNDTRKDILSEFSKNKIHIMITTPIIEVGIDFPNSTTIIIQSADRFGLAQLHQLRGRVGRGASQSYCYLFSESDNDRALNRLNMMTQTFDGQKIAEYDLATRGPGEAFSFIQHGFPSLKIANFSNLSQTALGQQIIEELTENYPEFDLKLLITNFDQSLASTN
jgi:ATP-dependent DNA helicase RecG